MAELAAFVSNGLTGFLVYGSEDPGAGPEANEIACSPAPTFGKMSQLFERVPEVLVPSTNATGFVEPDAGNMTVAITLPGMFSRN